MPEPSEPVRERWPCDARSVDCDSHVVDRLLASVHSDWAPHLALSLIDVLTSNDQGW